MKTMGVWEYWEVRRNMFDVYQLVTLVTGVNTQADLDFKVTEQKKIRHIETETSSILQGAFLTSLEQDLFIFSCLLSILHSTTAPTNFIIRRNREKTSHHRPVNPFS